MSKFLTYIKATESILSLIKDIEVRAMTTCHNEMIKDNDTDISYFPVSIDYSVKNLSDAEQIELKALKKNRSGIGLQVAWLPVHQCLSTLQTGRTGTFVWKGHACYG